MRYDNLPSELKTERAWVNVWNSSKLPMQSGIRKAASSTLPETWSSYEEAAAAVQRGTYDGIGYVFHDTLNRSPRNTRKARCLLTAVFLIISS